MQVFFIDFTNLESSEDLKKNNRILFEFTFYLPRPYEPNLIDNIISNFYNINIDT